MTEISQSKYSLSSHQEKSSMERIESTYYSVPTELSSSVGMVTKDMDTTGKFSAFIFPNVTILCW